MLSLSLSSSLSRLSAALIVALLTTGTAAAGGADVEISFDNQGAEQGVTVPGTTSFSFAGSNWKGGVVLQVSNEALASSSKTVWRVAERTEVAFAAPVADLRFFFVHAAGSPPVKAVAFSAEGQPLASVQSHAATTAGDPLNFAKLRSGKPIARVLIDGGFVDDFSWTNEVDLCSGGARLCVSQMPGTTSLSTNVDGGGEHGGRAYVIVASFERDGTPVGHARHAGVLDALGKATTALQLDALGDDVDVTLRLLVRTPHGFERIDEPLELR